MHSVISVYYMCLVNKSDEPTACARQKHAAKAVNGPPNGIGNWRRAFYLN